MHVTLSLSLALYIYIYVHIVELYIYTWWLFLEKRKKHRARESRPGRPGLGGVGDGHLLPAAGLQLAIPAGPCGGHRRGRCKRMAGMGRGWRGWHEIHGSKF